MSIRVMAAAVATAVGLGIATCGPAAGAAVAGAAVAGADVAGAAVAGVAPAVQLTGVQLLSALLPAADFPSGYKLDKPSIYDSGAHLLTMLRLINRVRAFR